jgi:hypothetical protein
MAPPQPRDPWSPYLEQAWMPPPGLNLTLSRIHSLTQASTQLHHGDEITISLFFFFSFFFFLFVPGS